ncbi:rhodanese-related sulfurtransferase [Chlamydiifrater volucris]|uniref:oxygen-dependent tRNA uridine(34) hydroxylase TrhO n=1 Tax=Chlamydiifrater volucris TaxID=2681470 RepID=UPI001BCDE7B5|nr:rhodanese-related sulfurtransferase [Chlamydiifrater volucris]
MKKDYYALAYYLFTKVEDPHLEVALHKELFRGMDVSCRIYISEEGINGQFSGFLPDAEAYMAWLKKRPAFSSVKFKIHHIRENIFPRVTVKYRKELVALGCRVDVSKGGGHVSPGEWKEMLDDPKFLILDVRNNYETKIGHFENAVLPDISTFREFPDYADKLSKEYDPATTPVMMYCTGGIRCELYSSLLKDRGFKEVYQLDGGVIAYGNQIGDDKWRGKLFVFDDRLAIPIDEKAPPRDPIVQCSSCGKLSDLYYNCANADCNTLFLSCPDCVRTSRGCCSEQCRNSPRVRSFDENRGNKPFRRAHLEKIAVASEQ